MTRRIKRHRIREIMTLSVAVDWPRAAPYHARIPTRVQRQRRLAAAEPFGPTAETR
jgi:hypothetical protein